MIEIPATQKKLEEAHSCFQLLQTSARKIPLNRGVFDQRLSAFLSAAYSVEDVLETESGKAFEGWVKRWWDSRDAQEQALHKFIRGERNAELHREGATVTSAPQEISYQEYLQRAEGMQSGRHLGYFYGPQWSGPYGTEIPRTPVQIDIPQLGDKEATEKCGQYLRLLDQMVQAFREATAGATERQQKQAKMRLYKIWLDPANQALMEKLRQPEESVDALVVRTLHALRKGERS